MRTFHPALTIRLKLMLLVAAAVAFANIAVGGFALWQEASRYAILKRDTLFSTAHVLAATAARATAHNDVSGISDSIHSIGRVAGLTFVEVLNAQGRPIVDMGATEQLLGDIELDESSGPIAISDLLATHSIMVSVPIVLSGETIGRLRLMSDTADLAPRLRAAMMTTLAGLGIALALGLAVALRLQGSITKPLTSLSKAMARVTRDHDYSVALTAATRDEVGVLVNGFNSMLSGIRERDANLARHREHLEQEVADRTADLSVARDAAESANEKKSAFLATMSHEIRTPMNGMLVMAELLAATDLPQRSRRYAEVIARSGQGLLAIINDILDFSKVEAGKLDLERVAMDPCQSVDTVLSLFAERARSKGLDLAGYIAPDVPSRIEGDPVRLNQVLSNLVNNALKFTGDGGVLLSVERDPARAGNLRFSIRDTGIGIPADKIGSIFSAFSQADQSTTRQYGGTGLGLTICQKLVEAMGAPIDVESRMGEGSVFSFSIACLIEGEEPAPAPLAMPNTQAMLCVAAPLTRQVLARYLAAAGYAAIEASQAALASALATPGLVIADSGARESLGRAALVSPVAKIIEIAPMGGQGAGTGAGATLATPVPRGELFEMLTRAAAGRPLLDARAHARVAAVALAHFGGARVLVADDSPVNREVAAEALSRFGVTPDFAEDGLQAALACAEKTYDLVLMDGSMPVLDGFDATRRIRAEEAARGASPTPVVALTAHVIGAGSDAWREAGMDGVLHKPFTIAQLGAILGRFLAQGEEPAPAALDAPAPGGDLPVIDPATLAQFGELSSSGFAARVTRLYAEHAPKSVAEIEARHASGGLEALGKAAHALKSMSLNTGASRVAAAASEIERMARHDGQSPPAERIEELRGLVAEALACLKAFNAPPHAAALAG